jgi:hypothetical protein
MDRSLTGGQPTWANHDGTVLRSNVPLDCQVVTGGGSGRHGEKVKDAPVQCAHDGELI